MNRSDSSAPKKARVLVAEDHPFYRRGLVDWLNGQATLTCCREADSVATTRRAAVDLRPDLILLDLGLPDGDGLGLIRELMETHPKIRILVLTQYDEIAYAHRALQAGARGYVMKSEGIATVRTAIQTTLKGEIYLSRRMNARLTQSLFPDPASNTPDLARLSDRELQVFQLLGTGSNTREVAERLKISPKTVETYREHLKEKLRLRDGATLLRTATRWVEHGRLDRP